MRKPVVLSLALLLTVALGHATASRQALAASAQEASREAQDLEKQRMLQASSKAIEVLTAQLDGDRSKLEKAVSESVAIYDQIVAANPANIKALNGRGSVKEMLAAGNGAADYNKAVELTTAALAKNDQDGEMYFNRAVAYRGLTSYANARADYQKAIALDPAKPHWALELKAMEATAQ